MKFTDISAYSQDTKVRYDKHESLMSMLSNNIGMPRNIHTIHSFLCALVPIDFTYILPLGLLRW